jgi:cytochrome c oxidase assembly factor CtaG
MPSVAPAISTGASAAVQLGPLAVLWLMYARRARTLARAGQPLAGWRQVCFYGGFLVIAAALTSLGAASRDLLWVQTIEQLLLGDIATLLIVLGLTGPLLAPLRVAPLERLRVLCHPAIALPLWVVDLYGWHLPVLYQAALRHSGIQLLEHAMFLGCGINMWMCLLGPLPRPAWFGNLGKLSYIVAVRVAGTVLANIFLWSGKIYYPYYLAGEARFHISPLADQSIAGAIMAGEEAILTLGLFCWLYLRTTHESRRHQELLGFAGARERPHARAAVSESAHDRSGVSARLEASSGAPERTQPLR